MLQGSAHMSVICGAADWEKTSEITIKWVRTGTIIWSSGFVFCWHVGCKLTSLAMSRNFCLLCLVVCMWTHLLLLTLCILLLSPSSDFHQAHVKNLYLHKHVYGFCVLPDFIIFLNKEIFTIKCIQGVRGALTEKTLFLLAQISYSMKPHDYYTSIFLLDQRCKTRPNKWVGR